MFHSVFTKLGSRGTAASALTWSVIAFLVNQLVELAVLVHAGRHHADLCQWDCKWYAGIVQGGYDLQPHGHGKEDAANWAFFPAFPLLAKLVSLLTGSSPELALVLASKLCFFGAIFLFVRFTASVDAAVSEPIAALTVGLSPYAIYGNVGYTEPMFLMLTCACFVALHAEKHVWAGWAGALLGAVRFAGIAAVPAYVVFTWRTFIKARTDLRERIFFGLALLPLGLALFMWFLHERSGDALAFSHIQRAWGRVPQNPFAHLMLGFEGTLINKMRAGMVVLVGVVLIWLVRGKRLHLAMFTLVCTLLPLTTGLWAMPRYIWWQAPVMFALAALVSRWYVWVLYLPVSLAGMLFMYQAWFAGKAFVV